MVVNEVLGRFMRGSPVTVMARVVMERALPDAALDRMFKQTARHQYEDKLLFSTVVKVLSAAVTRGRKSVRNSYQTDVQAKAQATLSALYTKLQNTETVVVSGLVRESYSRLLPLMHKLKAVRQPLFRGYCTKILDGAHLTGTDHRLKETRTLNSSPLPGQALVILQPDQRLISDVFPCEDAHAQERKLLDAVLATIVALDLVLADRNFCTTGFLFGLHQRRAGLIIRQHASTLQEKQLVGKRRRVGRTERGTVYEQGLQITNYDGEQLLLRRMTMVLDKPTTDGETEIHLLSNLPPRIGGLRIANAYLDRWRIENAFQEIEQALRGEMNTLCYPKAALLVFGIALLIYNVLAVVKGALQAKHGEVAAFDKLSGYCLASEIAAVHAGMLVALPPATWTKLVAFARHAQIGKLLTDTAAYVDVQQFLKATRGPKKPPPKRTGGLREKHVSTHRLLLTRKPNSLAKTL